MRIERQCNGRPLDLASPRCQPFHNPRMPLVHAVEVADRQGAMEESLGKLIEVAEEIHG
jgi:hypothetical protein